MKSKKFTYVLGILALLVWGVILYRIFNSVSGGSDDDFIPLKPAIGHQTANDYSTQIDTTPLLLNYKDPFRQVKQVDTAAKVVRSAGDVKVTSRPIIKPVFSWSFVKYSGYTRSTGSKKLLAVISINGQSAILQEGETVGDVKLLKNYQDSIKVMFKGRTGYIRMQ